MIIIICSHQSSCIMGTLVGCWLLLVSMHGILISITHIINNNNKGIRPGCWLLLVVSMHGIILLLIIINNKINKGIRPATTETEHKSSHNTHYYLSSFDYLSHQLSSRSSSPSPYAVGIEGPIVGQQQVEEERSWHSCAIQSPQTFVGG